MFPKKGQTWSYRDRGRTLAFLWAMTAVGGIAAGIYLLITRGEWIVLIAGVVALIATAVYARENEREHRGEP